MMTDTLPAANNSTSRPEVPFGRKLAAFFFQLIYLDYFFLLTWIFLYCAFGIIPSAVFWTIFIIFAILLYALLIGVYYANHYDRHPFYYQLLPYEIGDLVEIDPTEDSVYLKMENVYRVKYIDFVCTHFEFLNRPGVMNWPNEAHLNSRFIIWIVQYANDNSREWRSVTLPIIDAITEDGKYADYCIEIQEVEHCELWRQYDCVVESKDKLSKYLEGLEQEGVFKSGSTFENEKDSSDDIEKSRDNEGRKSSYNHDAYIVDEDEFIKIADDEADVENQIGGTSLKTIAQAESVDGEGQYDGKSHCNGVSCNDDYNIDYTEHDTLKKQEILRTKWVMKHQLSNFHSILDKKSFLCGCSWSI
ncbi:hypothetical protein FisN_14Hh105 [Fistulifera solaris]|uniref:Uncharacterized protein n=1 Tax=Fistulifera solaris TaxID=1519565 RepID=A0A1Z5K8E4_FISSO|nr:hypothetical protein FisN_14Hh105 [Fistulifera solaris]|eukprot:GAX22486.1 hypothetical protein FisN_14Hh105 [Fistulifera solaris]